MKRSFIASIVFFAIMLIAMRWQGRELVSGVSPKGIIDIEFAGSVERFNQIMAQWDRNAARLNVYLDYLFILSYSWMLYMLLHSIYRKSGWTITRYFMVLPLAAGLLDIVENLLLLKAFEQPDETLVAVIMNVAAIKFILIAIVCLFLTACFFILAGRRMKV